VFKDARPTHTYSTQPLSARWAPPPSACVNAVADEGGDAEAMGSGAGPNSGGGRRSGGGNPKP